MELPAHAKSSRKTEESGFERPRGAKDTSMFVLSDSTEDGPEAAAPKHDASRPVCAGLFSSNKLSGCVGSEAEAMGSRWAELRIGRGKSGRVRSRTKDSTPGQAPQDNAVVKPDHAKVRGGGEGPGEPKSKIGTRSSGRTQDVTGIMRSSLAGARSMAAAPRKVASDASEGAPMRPAPRSRTAGPRREGDLTSDGSPAIAESASDGEGSGQTIPNSSTRNSM